MANDKAAVTVREILEIDLTWRLDEIRFLRNQLSQLQKDIDRRRLQRALVVMLYAHFEGFAKTAMREYARTVTRAGVACSEAIPEIIAASIAAEFDALNTDKKAPEFREEDDSRIHKQWRRATFIKELEGRLKQPVVLGESLSETESNLTPRVLKKMLYLAGLDPNLVKEHHGVIHELVSRRNDIAHGESQEGFKEGAYERIEAAVLDAMESVMRAVEQAVRNEAYRTPAAA